MEWYWPALSGLMKLGLAFGPKAIRRNEFGFDSEILWKEAIEVVSVGSCRTMLATTPVVMAILTIGKSASDCPDGATFALPIVATAIALVLAVWGALHINAKFFKSTASLFLVMVLLVGVEVVYLQYARDRVALALCAKPAPGSPALKSP